MTAYLKRWPAPKTFAAPGDEIKGTLVAWDETSEKHPVLHIKTADGLVRIVRATQARLHERLADLLPEPGDRLWIRYDGEAPRSAPGMARVKEFTVEIRRADPRPQNRADGTSGEMNPSENGSAVGELDK